jgi:streptogramin lyase
LPSDPSTAVEYPTILPVTNTLGITKGPDGNIWFIEDDHANNASRVARIDLAKLNGCGANPSLCITEFVVPGNENAAGQTLASGPDGAIWFVNGFNGKVGRVTTGGAVTLFDVPASLYAGGGITGGPDGALWYSATNKIGRITTSGAVTEIGTPSPYNGGRITAGPDGNIWFLEPQANKVGRVNLTGAAPTPTPGGSTPTPTPTHGSGGPTPTPAPRGHVTPIPYRTPIPHSNGRP